MPTNGGEPNARKRDCEPGAVKHALSAPLLLLHERGCLLGCSAVIHTLGGHDVESG